MNFGQWAEVIYDVCTRPENNLNPILCVAQAGQEQGFHAGGGNYNFWGIAVYNNQDTGYSAPSMEKAVETWCGVYKSYNDNPSVCQERSELYSEYFPEKFNPNNRNLYFYITYYKSLGSIHGDKAWGSRNVKYYIDNYLYKYLTETCNHKLDDPLTDEERAADVVFYVDDGLIPVAEQVFGDKAFFTSNIPSDILHASPEEKLEYLFPGGVPSTPGQAWAYMVWVTVPITTKAGEKTTMNVCVHEALADGLVYALQVAQDSGFPVYDVQTYAWRDVKDTDFRSHHSYGIAVDINPNENFCVYSTGKVDAGSYWRPYEDPYSIPPDGALVEAFKSVGWVWGGDWEHGKKDYMHFSFTGY